MTDVLRAILLGVIQGLTEFLPISSTGHLVLAEAALGVSETEFGLRFDAAIHLGTLTAVLLYFRATLRGLAVAWLASLRRRDWRATRESRLAWLLLLGTVPGGVAGLALEGLVEDTFRSPALVGLLLVLFCLPLLLAERLGRRLRGTDSAGPRDALTIGTAQAVALLPGVSRSGITIATGMLLGLRREEAAVFAFLLSAPIIAAAGGKQLFDILRGEAGTAGADAWLVYGTGLATAAVVGYAAIYFLVRYLRTNTLYPFVIYRLALGLSVLALSAAGML